MRLIGDVHRDFDRYEAQLRESPEPSVQLGDMGIFTSKDVARVTELHADGNSHFIEGNHDDIRRCQHVPGYRPRGSVISIEGRVVFFFGGALSIDKAQRTPGHDWFPTEQGSEAEMITSESIYSTMQPDVVITHDAPLEALGRFYREHPVYLNRTTKFLSRLLEIHQPETWIFGHHHRYFHTNLAGTDFYCVPPGGELKL